MQVRSRQVGIARPRADSRAGTERDLDAMDLGEGSDGTLVVPPHSNPHVDLLTLARTDGGWVPVVRGRACRARHFLLEECERVVALDVK